MRHLSTANVARDLDLLRRAVGDDRLTYDGASYGSFIGSVYANLFPNRVRAMVLDGVIDPVAWTTGRPRAAHTLPFSVRHGSMPTAREAALGQFLTRCDAAGPAACALAPNAGRKLDRLFSHVPRRARVGGLGYDTINTIVLGVLVQHPHVGHRGRVPAPAVRRRLLGRSLRRRRSRSRASCRPGVWPAATPPTR